MKYSIQLNDNKGTLSVGNNCKVSFCYSIALKHAKEYQAKTGIGFHLLGDNWKEVRGIS